MSARRIKLAFVIDDLGYGGAQRQLSLVAPALAARGVDVLVACMSEVTTPFAAVLRGRGVPLTTFARRRGVDPSRLFALRRYLVGERPDVVHSFSDASNVYAFLATRGLGLRLVASMRSDRISLRGARARVLPSILRRSDFVVTNSSAGRDTLVTRIGLRAERVLLVRNCVEVEAPAPAGDGPRGGRRVGFVGRLVPLKRPERLIDAFASISTDVPDAELVVVGEGSERDALAARVHRAGLDGRVTFTGTVEDARPLMRTFSCLVLPSSHEGLPNAILEALSVGIPVVASPVGDIPDLVVEGRTGLLLPDDSVGALAAAIARALGDAELSRRARAEGPRFAQDHFSVDRAADALGALYRSLA
jgi:glycosyltransferase involved in cell wall biosynthesis